MRGRSGDRFGRFVARMSSLGVMIGVLSLVTVISVMNGFEQQLKSRILGVLPQAYLELKSGATSLNQPLSAQLLASMPKVQKIAPLVMSEGVVQSADELSAGMVLGIDQSTLKSLRPMLIASSKTPLLSGEYRVILGHGLAQALNVVVGDKVRLMVTSASQFTPLGRIPSQRNFQVSAIFNTGSDIDSQLMFIDLADAQRLMRLSESSITGWRLYFDDPFVVSELAPRFAEDSTWIWHDWREQRGELFQAVKMEKNMMGLMLSLIVGIAAFNIISALIMVVSDKQAEVAILKTQGIKDRSVLMIFVIQGASSSVIGSLVGAGLGVLLATYINSILSLVGANLISMGGQLPVVISPWQVVFTIVATISLSIISTLYPAYRAAKIQPSEALRYE